LDLVESPALEVLDEIDRVLESISAQVSGQYWTPEAVAMSAIWAEQRLRARLALDLMGEARADEVLPGHV